MISSIFGSKSGGEQIDANSKSVERICPALAVPVPTEETDAASFALG